ncbi:MAG: YqjK family protein [Betaproteobacteria bacterium]
MIYTERYNQIARKRAQLIADCAHQRAALADELGAWQTPVRTLDRGLAVMRFLQAYPLAAVTAVGVVAVLSRRRLLTWASRALLVWRGWQTVRALLHSLTA